MKQLRLRVIFDCRERIYSDEEVIGHKAITEVMVFLNNWQDVLDFISDKSLHDIDCEVFNIVPCEVETCEEETAEESELQEEDATAAASCSDVEAATLLDK